MNENEKILVTGGNGLVGAYIIRYLLKLGYRNIKATIRPSAVCDHISDFIDQIDICPLDIRNVLDVYEEVDSIDYVFHTAAMVNFSNRAKKEMAEINVGGTMHLVDASLEKKVKKFIFISSVAALGRAKFFNFAQDEKTEWVESKYNSAYAVNKYLAELEVWRGWAEGLSTYIVAPSLILGEGDFTRSSLVMYNKLKLQRKFYPQGSTGFVDVRDVASLAVKAALSDRAGEKVIASSENRKFKDVMGKMAMELGLQPPTLKMPMILGQCMVWEERIRSFITGGTPVITRSSLYSLMGRNEYINQKSINVFSHDYIPIDQSIKETCQIFSGIRKGPLLWNEN
ncbi:MAG TPA: NAD-dependent epimerase/dehydratase family protein [Saprospiraceae bacterium]|nr:NAD-dependent epimerase/dehydratase family protein [Saprospiraceae bacterium]